MRLLFLFLLAFSLLGASPVLKAESPTPRSLVVKAILTENEDERVALVAGLAGTTDDSILPLLQAWKEDSLFILETEKEGKVPVQLVGEKGPDDTQEALRILDGQPLLSMEGKPARLNAADLIAVEHNSPLRRAMKEVADLADLGSSDPKRRIQAVLTIGYAQDLAKLETLRKRLSLETDPEVGRALKEALALLLLKSDQAPQRMAALDDLRELHSMGSVDLLRVAQKEAAAAGRTAEAEGARTALVAIERHRSWVNFYGTLFRGLSLGSILLVVALGLAITFGLMRVINMAHGEMIAIGAYTTYVVQNLFGQGMTISPFGKFTLSLPGANSSGWVYESYFIIALPLSFLSAAFIGILLERSVIRFLYKRPLESLLATWGVSLVLQQLFKLIFGANNVQVSSPSYLSGNWTIADVILGWNRVFVIGFAALIVFGTWLVLTRSSLGLLIRAVMQNRGMASCMGVRTERVNMMTFALGSGLAGLAGAFLSQIGNVGPSLGQNYIVDCFMTVVVGGVGNLGGTVISAAGIGLLDQSLQQILLNPVLGKILVLAGIILFLQWRPAGIFVTRSRSLDD